MCFIHKRLSCLVKVGQWNLTIPSFFIFLGDSIFEDRTVYVSYSGSSWDTLVSNSHENALSGATIY